MKVIFVVNDRKHFGILKKNGVKNYLFSYAYSNELERRIPDLDETDNLIVDSGAFTMWTKGKEVNLDEYIEFCKKIKAIAKCKISFVNLDVIPGSFGHKPSKEDIEKGAEKGWANYEKMTKAGLKVIHIFHQHEDFKWLDRLKESSDYIGISPANDLSIQLRLNWLDKVYAHIKNEVKTHCFGLTSPRAALRYPFYSCDSSTWLMGSRFATFYKFKDGKMLSYNKKHKNLAEKFNAHTFDREAFGSQNIKALLELQEYGTKLWAKRNVLWKE
jgi:hypothetical protein